MDYEEFVIFGVKARRTIRKFKLLMDFKLLTGSFQEKWFWEYFA